jgi:hypothetical protein
VWLFVVLMYARVWEAHEQHDIKTAGLLQSVRSFHRRSRSCGPFSVLALFPILRVSAARTLPKAETQNHQSYLHALLSSRGVRAQNRNPRAMKARKLGTWPWSTPQNSTPSSGVSTSGSCPLWPLIHHKLVPLPRPLLEARPKRKVLQHDGRSDRDVERRGPGSVLRDVNEAVAQCCLLGRQPRALHMVTCPD